ncbi:MAG: FkbM family methyltransferase [Microgenomates group bacterium Gr01-1014_16]|nr:MAG: FkbM family methyltransferase [Microgenomates group bacterium Gr01-1014_16]
MGIKTKKFKNWLISYVNEAELDEMLKELYEKNYYQFDTSKPDPVIFDVGALIGETVLYFKEQFPKAKITAFEPSPRSFALLKKNISQNKLTRIKLVNAAVAGKSGKMNFYTSKSKQNPWGRGDSLKENKFNNKDRSKIVQVSTVRLSQYINSPIDLLKLDIEGAETEVVQEIEPKLKLVKNIILEFHASPYNPENKLSTILKILQRNNFKSKFFISQWPIPQFGVNIVLVILPLLKIDEFWLRIYAKH